MAFCQGVISFPDLRLLAALFSSTSSLLGLLVQSYATWPSLPHRTQNMVDLQTLVSRCLTRWVSTFTSCFASNSATLFLSASTSVDVSVTGRTSLCSGTSGVVDNALLRTLRSRSRLSVLRPSSRRTHVIRLG